MGSPTVPSRRSDERSWRARVLLAHLDERADQGRRRVVGAHAVALDDLPVPVPVGVRGVSLVENARRAVRQRPVDDVRVARHPADVRRAPPHRVVVDVEDPLVGDGRVQQIAPRRVERALGLGGRSRRMEEEERVLGAHRLRLARLGDVAIRSCHQTSSASQGTGSPVRRRHDDVLDAGRERDRPGRRSPSAAPCPPLRQPSSCVIRRLRAGVAQALGERLGREAAEHDDVRRPDPGAGEHRDRQLRDHPHVDPDPVALADAELPEPVGEPADLASASRRRSIDRRLVGRLGLPVVGDAVPAPGSTWRSRQLYDAFSTPSANQVQCGGSQRSPVVGAFEPGEELAGESRPEALEVRLGLAVDGSRPRSAQSAGSPRAAGTCAAR